MQILVVGLFGALASGCAGGSVETASAARTGHESTGALPAGPVDTGTYPNLNIPRKAAAPQITDKEKQESIAALQAARSGQAGSAVAAPTTSETADLRKLGDAHGKKTLEAIEGGD